MKKEYTATAEREEQRAWKQEEKMKGSLGGQKGKIQGVGNDSEVGPCRWEDAWNTVVSAAMGIGDSSSLAPAKSTRAFSSEAFKSHSLMGHRVVVNQGPEVMSLRDKETQGNMKIS